MNLETRTTSLLDSHNNIARLHHLLNSTPSVIYSTEADGDYACTFVNDNVHTVLGFTREEIMVDSNFWYNHIHDEDRDHVIKQFYAQIWAGHGELEYRFKCKNNQYIWIHDSHRMICDDNGQPLEIVGSWTDITVRQELNEQLAYQASHDSLTGLVNREEFEKRLKNILYSVRKKNSEGALCYLDLDQFKVINDSLGHAAGDKMLDEISSILYGHIRNRDTLARLGGDEFGIILEHCCIEEAEKVGRKLRRAIQKYRFSWRGKFHCIGVSIGVTKLDAGSRGITDVLKQADSACYMAKELGRNRVYVYHEDNLDVEQRLSEMVLVAEINQALDENRFELHYQLIVPTDPANSHGLHYEVLVRMLSKEGKRIPPGLFLGAAERYGLAIRIDKWVVQNTLNWLHAHPEQADSLAVCSINLSGNSVGDSDMKDFLRVLIVNSNVDARKICFEITETAAMHNIDTAIEFISSLRELGCKFALDDFGTGLSSFAYLSKLPIDYLKIDGAFVKDIATNPVHEVFVKAINDVGHVMKLETIAEFVEDEDIFAELRKLGVDYAQGYGIGKPQPLNLLLEQSEEEIA